MGGRPARSCCAAPLIAGALAPMRRSAACVQKLVCFAAVGHLHLDVPHSRHIVASPGARSRVAEGAAPDAHPSLGASVLANTWCITHVSTAIGEGLAARLLG